MSGREILLHHLIGRTVHDADGCAIGRIQELCAEIELHEHGNEYVVREFHVGAFGVFEALMGSQFARRIAEVLRLGRSARYTIPWDLMNLDDPEHPRVTVSQSRLS